jgi:hypothetical protein
MADANGRSASWIGDFMAIFPKLSVMADVLPLHPTGARSGAQRPSLVLVLDPVK